MINSGQNSFRQASAAKSDSKAKKARILVVDDEPDIREFLQIALTASGNCEVEVASSASEALVAIDQLYGTFDCLLLDIQMPMISGVDLCEVVRQNPEYAHVPIVMVTAMSERKYLDSAFFNGATDYICKPFDVMDLRMRIGRARQKLGQQPHNIERKPPPLIAQTDNPSEEKPTLDHPVYLAGIDRFVSVNAFENYVLQSASQGQKNVFVRAVKIVNIQNFHRALSEKNFCNVLGCVAELLSDEITHCGGVLSYRGNGVFLHTGLSDIGLTGGGPNWQANRKMYLDNIKKVSGYQIDLVIGDKVPVSGLSKSGVLFEMNKAIVDVDEKDTQTKKWTTYPEWQIEQSSQGKEREHIELNAYKNLLQNMLLEKNCRLQ